MAGEPTIRRAGEHDTGTLAEAFRLMWHESGFAEESFREDADARVAAFVERTREEGEFAAFLAEAEGAVVGTAACQTYAGLYPEIRRRAVHLTGYIWCVYVWPEHRRRGLATRLTRAALSHLEGIGCTRVRLHASRQGAPVYRALGFEPTNELGLELRPSGG